mmetsp:Transcript_21263/g.56825  ORF Transcript_21263/g.56825 Transcript_21263/m.56825 type:complete len:341 (-) Transcript_21263:116-1138(-)
MRHAPVLRGRRRIHLALVAQYERHLSRQFLPCVGAVVFGEHHRALHHLLPSPRAHHQHLPQPQQYFCHRLLTPRGVHHHRTPSLLAHHELRPRQRRGRRQLAFPKQREVRDPHPLLAEDGEGIRGRSDAGAGDDDRGLRAERNDGCALFTLVGHEMEHDLEIVVQLRHAQHPHAALGLLRHLHRKRNHQLPMQHRQTILPKFHPSLHHLLPIKQYHLPPFHPHILHLIHLLNPAPDLLHVRPPDLVPRPQRDGRAERPEPARVGDLEEHGAGEDGARGGCGRGEEDGRFVAEGVGGGDGDALLRRRHCAGGAGGFEGRGVRKACWRGDGVLVEGKEFSIL